jgi:hypothetical protein
VTGSFLGEAIKASSREADRKGMLHAMRSMMLHRTGHISPLLTEFRAAAVPKS